MPEERAQRTLAIARTTLQVVREGRALKSDMLEALLSTQEKIQKTRELIRQTDKAIQACAGLGPIDRLNLLPAARSRLADILNRLELL